MSHTDTQTFPPLIYVQITNVPPPCKSKITNMGLSSCQHYKPGFFKASTLRVLPTKLSNLFHSFNPFYTLTDIHTSRRRQVFFFLYTFSLLLLNSGRFLAFFVLRNPAQIWLLFLTCYRSSVRQVTCVRYLLLMADHCHMCAPY